MIGCGTEGPPVREPDIVEQAIIVNAPASSVFAPADYDHDGLTDFALKGSNGIWYIDLARCSTAHKPETNCSNYVDDDNDGRVNDGCPAVGTPEPANPQQPGPECDPVHPTVNDNDLDGFFEDGCPTSPQCLGSNGFGGRWDFAYPGYGGATAQPVPADYGSYGTNGNGPADGFADLAIKNTATGMWAIDYADNGFGSFDLVFYGYGFGNTVPFPADYDGDDRADLVIRTTTGEWYFDYSSNGFGGWDVPMTPSSCPGGCPCTIPNAPWYAIGGYGGSADTPAVGDFDGDGCDDLSVKTTTGHWYFDLAADGFTGWDPPCAGCPIPLPGYGDQTNRPIVADYDSNGLADLAVVTSTGHWSVDFAPAFGAWNIWPMRFLGWSGFSRTSSTVIPGHFKSTTGLLDQSVKNTNGQWHVDDAANGYVASGSPDSTVSNNARVIVDFDHAYISQTTVSAPIRPPTCGDGVCSGNETCFNCADECGFCTGNFTETTVDPNDLKIGVRYTANVHVEPGLAYPPCVNVPCAPPRVCIDGLCYDHVEVKYNPDARIPRDLNMVNIGGHTVGTVSAPVVYSHARRFAFTCAQYGPQPIGFMFSNGLNADYGTGVFCRSDHPGLYGTVTSKQSGFPIEGATVTVGRQQVPTNASGFWNLPGLTGGPHKVTVMKTGYSSAIAVNVRIPVSPPRLGVQIDTALEEPFVLPQGTVYRTYLDYSRGRSILHVVEVDVTRAPITLGKTGADLNCVPNEEGCGGCWDGPGSDFKRLRDVAVTQNAPVMINGIWWMHEAAVNYVQAYPVGSPQICGGGAPNPNPAVCCNRAGEPVANTRSIGYLYINGYVSPGKCENGVCRPSDVECAEAKIFADPDPNRAPISPPGDPVLIQNQWKLPLFGVKGTGTQQRVNIIPTDNDFLRSNNGWKRVAGIPNCPAGFTCPIFAPGSNATRSR